VVRQSYQQLAIRSLFPARIEPRHRFMIPLATYFDESQSFTGAKVFAVGGFISGLEQWVEFEPKWKDEVDSWGTKPDGTPLFDHFHMTDFESYKGQYENWTKDEHESRLNKLLILIHDHTVGGVGVAFSEVEYEAGFSERLRRKITPDHILSILAFMSVSQMLKHIGLVGEIAKSDIPKSLPPDFPPLDSDFDLRSAYIFEDRQTGKGPIRDVSDIINANPTLKDSMHMLHEVNFLPKRDFGALQAADMLAFETQKYAVNLLDPKPRDMRYSLKQLLPKNNRWNMYSASELRWFNPLLEHVFRERL
jgi:hypothetical protein